MRPFIRPPLLAKTAVVSCAIIALGGCTTSAPESVAPTAALPSSPAPTVVVSNTALPLAGKVPFLDVIADDSDARALVIQADLDRTIGISCTRTINRPIVQETATRVIVLVAAYADPPAPGTACDGQGDTEPIPIQLSSPLGSRTLIDRTTGRSHPVLDPSSVPTLLAPEGAVADPLRWDDTTRVATRRWQARDDTIWLSTGPRIEIDRGAPLPSRTSTDVNINGTLGQVWHGGGPYDVVAVRWPLRDGRTIELRTVKDRPATNSLDQAIALARTVH